MDSLVLNQNKMTAVSSLVERLLPLIDRSKISDVALHSIVEEYLAMEKEQIIDFAVKFMMQDRPVVSFYNQTFKSE